MDKYLAEALNEISEKHIAEAAAMRPRRKKYALGAIAAILAIALLANIGFIPGAISAKAVSTASESRAAQWPDPDDYSDDERDQWRKDFDRYLAERDKVALESDRALTALMPFYAGTTEVYLANAAGNRVWSPVNAYIALAMLAEVTDGSSRQQIMELLNTPDPDTLRTQVGAVWETVYTDDGNEICRLANSLWLDENLRYDQNTMDSLAYYHYASVFQGDLSSDKSAKALQTWLNNNTGGLLKDQVANAAFPPEAVMTLASTVYLQSKWADQFNPARNTDEIFHAPSGDREATFMNKKELQTSYYWGSSYGAVTLNLQNGSRMWLILPDEDKSVDDVLTEGQFWELLMPSEKEPENRKYMMVNLSMPKFDINSSCDLKAMLTGMGVTDIFDLQKSDFTAITSDSPIVIGAVNQAARVVVDEDGVKAASYIEIPGAGAAMPPEEIIDFVLDRPFLFIIADYSGIPLFTGVVNEP